MHVDGRSVQKGFGKIEFISGLIFSEIGGVEGADGPGRRT